MPSPIKVTADLSEGLNALLLLIPNGVKAIGERLTEEYDYRRDTRRMRNIANAAALAIPEIKETATSPDDDWMTEWFDLASKRSYPEWQHVLGKMLASEANAPGSVPMRYFVDMARLDKEVMAEFEKYCGWYVPGLKQIVKEGNIVPNYVREANLIDHSINNYTITIDNVRWFKGISFTVNGQNIVLRNERHILPIGNYSLTNFGKLIYTLLDPKPPLDPDLAQSLRELWENHLHPDNAPAS